MTRIPASSMLVEIDFRSYWRAGTGRAGGEDADSLIDRDADRLPVLRGRHLKGLLREAAARLCDWGAPGWSMARVNLLFGRKAEERQKSTPACVRFGDARLPAPIGVKARENEKLANEFVRRLAFTRIDFHSGAARDKTLRSVEAAVPLRLQARLTWDPAERSAIETFANEETAEQIDALAGCWDAAVAECLPYVLAAGAQRNRGFGRAVLSRVEG